MNASFFTHVLTANASFQGQTSLPGDDDRQVAGAAAYLLREVNRLLWLVVPPVLLALGCYGNVMVIVVMRAMRASESTGCLSVYFTALAVSDLFVLWTNVLSFWPEMALDAPLGYFHDLSCTVPFFVSDVSSMTSAWFLVAMTCQRMTSVVLPHRVEELCTVEKGKIIAATISVVSFVANLYIFFYYHLERMEGYPSCVSSDKHETNILGFFYLCVSSAIPFLCLVIANSILIYGVVQSLKLSGRMVRMGNTSASSRLTAVSSMTTTLILTSAAFLLLSLPSNIVWSYLEMIGYFEGEIEDETLYEQLGLVDTVCILLWLSNSAINFYIYILSGRKFRVEAKQYVYLCFRSLGRLRFGFFE